MVCHGSSGLSRVLGFFDRLGFKNSPAATFSKHSKNLSKQQPYELSLHCQHLILYQLLDGPGLARAKSRDSNGCAMEGLGCTRVSSYLHF